ncbi:response regulator transcription factor [Halobacillus sp. BAB-2008]|uniref:response regulator transcription factor n=1 Tax=Halobacillus sp. BAB-2008 TaxID=1246484 RepID=UPI0002A4EB9A|nr:response regulator transcription factor [Halobacillus sp. BAB-2008]ELK47930.1 winged helix family two component transcriptional regulator [Halobacillus sp. BAB-2008]
MKADILVIEDEQKIARVLEIELEYEGYTVTKAHDGAEGMDLFRSKSWDLVLLDVMLPSMSGTDVLKRIRKGDTATPVIMLTAKDNVEDKVTGLDLGANDYVTKPFDFEELLARIRAALRFKPADETGEPGLSLADLKVNESTHEVSRGEDKIDLTAKEFALLVYLLKNKRQVLNREQLLDGVWGYDYYGDTNIVDVYIRYLRNKMDKNYEPKLLHTVRGVGYVLKDLR